MIEGRTQKQLKAAYEEDIYTAWRNGAPRVIVVAVKLPSGAIETITNYDGLADKGLYYQQAYDDEFRLKANPAVQIVGYMIV